MADTSIEWTEKTWNPVAGCTILSPGCTNCYAMRMASRLEAMGSAKYAGLTRKSGGRAKWTGIVRFQKVPTPAAGTCATASDPYADPEETITGAASGQTVSAARHSAP